MAAKQLFIARTLGGHGVEVAQHRGDAYLQMSPRVAGVAPVNSEGAFVATMYEVGLV